MHEVLGKAITCQTSSIIFSLTRLFFSADAHDLEAAGLFVLCLFFFSPDLMLSWLPSCWFGRVAVSKGLCHSLGFLSIPYVPGNYGSLDVSSDWDPNMNVHVNHFISKLLQCFLQVGCGKKPARLQPEDEPLLFTVLNFAITDALCWQSVCVFFFSPSLPPFGLIGTQVSSAWPYSKLKTSWLCHNS